MKFEVTTERHYRHGVSEVWAALTSAEALSDWLMETRDFKPENGRAFELHCTNESGHLDVYKCEILEIDPPHRMLWSWVLAGNESKGLTHVEFQLSPTETGTRLTLIHRGDRDPELLERFRLGWPHKLDQLAEILEATSERRGRSESAP